MQKSIWYLTVILVSLSLIVVGCSQSGARGDARGGGGNDAVKPIPVKVAEVARREIQRNVDVVGSLLPNEEVVVSSEVDGRVDKVLADIGDWVQKGQVLLQVSPEEFQYQLNGKLAQFHQALAKLGMKDENSPIPPDELVPDVQKAVADRNVAEQDYQRAKDLYGQSLIPQQQLDAAESKFISARATYETTLQQIQIAKASIDQARSDVELTRKKLRDTEIKAPFSGWIKERVVAPGQYLKVQAPVFTIVDVNPLRFTAEVPDRIAPWIKTGSPVELHIEAYPDRTFEGKIARIGPSSNQSSRTFTVEALIANGQGLLKPGFFAKANISTSRQDSILTVPAEAVSFAYGVYKIYVVKGDEISLMDVKIGDRIGDDVELLEGANEHMKVAVSNLAKLKDGSKIESGGGRESSNLAGQSAEGK